MLVCACSVACIFRASSCRKAGVPLISGFTNSSTPCYFTAVAEHALPVMPLQQAPFSWFGRTSKCSKTDKLKLPHNARPTLLSDQDGVGGEGSELFSAKTFGPNNICTYTNNDDNHHNHNNNRRR